MPESTPTHATSTRERLLEAAGEVFASHGYRAATIRRICRAADVNVGAINYHFGDKERLYHEVLHFAFDQVHERHPIREPDPTTSVETRLHALVSGLLSRLLSARASWHGRLFAREFADPTAALQPVVARFIRPLVTRLEALVAEARPDLTPERRRLHALSLLGQCVFYKHARPVLDVLYGADAYGPDDLEPLADHIVAAFSRGLELPHE